MLAHVYSWNMLLQSQNFKTSKYIMSWGYTYKSYAINKTSIVHLQLQKNDILSKYNKKDFLDLFKKQ